MQSKSSGLSWSQDLYLKAIHYVADKHRGQTVPGSDGLPYLLHLSSVCMEVFGALSVEKSADADLSMQCALLHDVLEDTETSFEELVTAFSPEVAAGVDALTKRESVGDKAAQMADSLDRIKAQPKAVWIVKLADRITNLQPPPSQWPNEKCTRYRDEAIAIQQSLGSASSYLNERMKTKIESYAQYT
jgi:(p)ppGpp synthase/HD superfamily hydrolase